MNKVVAKGIKEKIKELQSTYGWKLSEREEFILTSSFIAGYEEGQDAVRSEKG